jgi:hypothetical protein
MAKTSEIHWMSWEKTGRSKSVGGLGFRDLVLFNRALLAKQGWRLIQQLSSITAKILKAKYFPHSSFLKASLRSPASLVWRSIFNGSELLQQGLIWRVGNGGLIKVWNDRWLPTPITHTVQSPPRVLVDNAMMTALINPERRCWNVELIK